ncbi:DUF1381 domain-containing protein [Staphylococcus saprophyticus]|uniref:DUF1381 domain-containing protein n=1 Tax=Staphylococcus saprophyticus TaxID=29385 RepID=UPI00157CA8BE|nr:DUF1381 domain-containing protein [Staphylococcus saprophyticus]
MQYLIRTLTDSTGYPFTEVIKPRENEKFTVVEAESKEEAEKMVKESIQCPRCESWNTNNEIIYENNEPIFTHFICYDCDAVYGEYIEKDSE